jgi:PEP-CTERM motif
VSQLQNGQSYYFGSSLYAYANQLEVNTTPIPEPETWAMMLGGLGLLAGLRRYRSAGSR